MPIRMKDIQDLSGYTRDGVNARLKKPDGMICETPKPHPGRPRDFPPDLAMEFGFRGNLAGLNLYDFEVDAIVVSWLELWRSGLLPPFWAINPKKKREGVPLDHADIPVEELMHSLADDSVGGFVGAPETHTEHKPATRIAVINLGEIARRVEALSDQE